MITKSNVDLTREAYAAVATNEEQDNAAGEPAGSLFALFADDVEVHHGGNGPFAGTHHGRADIQATMARAFALSNGTFREFEPHVVAGDEKIVYTAARATARRPDGRELDMIVGAVFRFEDHRIVEVWQHLEDQAAWDEFWT